ncbi:hypothetical protein CEXT_66941 [Caerostris extrusa]|uniref:Uncharacterized protein n=1 Tax=Caerostris extrusa TaxID=172846 RepID=A0AAV4RS90_CAEEX|nr:hypothetical protein CEXT_66941 [Caerostris extrusa]
MHSAKTRVEHQRCHYRKRNSLAINNLHIEQQFASGLVPNAKLTNPNCGKVNKTRNEICNSHELSPQVSCFEIKNAQSQNTSSGNPNFEEHQIKHQRCHWRKRNSLAINNLHIEQQFASGVAPNAKLTNPNCGKVNKIRNEICNSHELAVICHAEKLHWIPNWIGLAGLN